MRPSNFTELKVYVMLSVVGISKQLKFRQSIFLYSPCANLEGIKDVQYNKF